MAVQNVDLGVYLHITYQGKKYYISDAARTASVTYFPFLASSPQITYGGDGYAKVTTGSISILRYIEDYPNIHYQDHPFAGDRYISLLTSVQEIPFELYLGDRYIPLFSGTLTLDNVSENTLDFLVQEEEFKQVVVFPALYEEHQITSNIYFEKINDFDYELIIYLNQNNFTTDDTIIFEKEYGSSLLECDELAFNKAQQNIYNITNTTEFTFKIIDSEDRNLIKSEDIGIFPDLLTKDEDHPLQSYDTGSSSIIYKLSSDEAQIYKVGKFQYNPFSYGSIEIRNPVLKLGSSNLSTNEVNITVASASALDGYTFEAINGLTFLEFPSVRGENLIIQNDYYSSHPLGFSSTDPNVEITPILNVVEDNQFNGGEVKINLVGLESDLYFYCTNHHSMNGKIEYEIVDNFYLLKNPSIDLTDLSKFKLFDDGVDITENTAILSSTEDYIALTATPVGEIGISGVSKNGVTLYDFYSTICKYLNGSEVNKVGGDEIDMDNLDDLPDFSLAPDANIHSVPIYQDSEITAIEIANKVSQAVNYQFFFLPYREDNSEIIRKKMVVVDTLSSFLNNELHASSTTPLRDTTILTNVINESDQIKINLSYPFPTKAVETTITVNRLYQASAGEVRNQSKMQPQDVTFRVGVHTIGNITNFEILANDINDGVFWLSRKGLLVTRPDVSIIIREAREDLQLGQKIRIFDEVRGIMIDMMIQKIGYDFKERKTTVSGISQISNIEVY